MTVTADQTDVPDHSHLGDDDLSGVWRRGDQVDAAALKQTAGAFPSGVTVITTVQGIRPVGMTVSSFTTVSIDPPLVLVCVDRRASCLHAFRIGAPMGVNVLGCEQGPLARTFAGRGEDRFDGVEYRAGPHGVPLLEGTSAWLSTHIDRIYDGGDHQILVARVHAVHRDDTPPLLYHSGRMHDWAVAAVASHVEQH